MIIARSFWRKALVTAVAAGTFVSLYEATMLDSKYGTLDGVLHDVAALPVPGGRLRFGATAYCKGLATTSGVSVQSGILAADPEVLPVGSVVQLDAPDPHYDGIYTVLDTGANVQGRLVDIYMWSCNEAIQFGHRTVRLTVLRRGWNPKATAPSLLDRLFKHPEQAPLPSRPLPQVAP